MNFDSCLDTAKTKNDLLQLVNKKGSVRLSTCRERLERDERIFIFSILELIEEEKILVIGGRYLELATPGHVGQVKALAYGGKRPAGVRVVSETDEEKARRIAEEVATKASRLAEEEAAILAEAAYDDKLRSALEDISNNWFKVLPAYRQSYEAQQEKQRVSDPAEINRILAGIRRQFFKDEFRRAMPGADLPDDLLNEYSPAAV